MTRTMMTLAQAHALLPGSTRLGDADIAINRVHSDTRSLQAGDLFVALKGERFDAHDFLPQAAAAGAVAAIATHGLVDARLPGLQVADTRVALGELAAAWRARFDLPLIAVTGSNGKTTVTQMIAAILVAWQGEGAFSTQGNLNNDIGVPLTLLRLRQDEATWHRAGVVELGMNHPGEIAALAAMTAPTVALVNNAQREHQEFMQSVEAVARENGAVIEALGPHGIAVFPADDPFTPLWRELAGDRKVVTFALDGPADVTATASWMGDGWSMQLETPWGTITQRLEVAGRHNLKNALAAAACVVAAREQLRDPPPDGVDRTLAAISDGLASFQPVKGRSQLKQFVRGGRHVHLVDDTYNANPDSVRAAIDVLATMHGPRWLVLGDMGEVGDRGPEFHAEIGHYAQDRGIDALWTAGVLSTHASAAFHGARHFEDVAQLLAALWQAPEAASIVVKGSRFMKMEQVVAAMMVEIDAPVVGGGAHAA